MTVPPDPPAAMAPDPGPDGLSAAEARARQARFGRNEVPETRPGLLAALAGTLWAPVPWMLEAAILLQAFLGEYLEAGLIPARFDVDP